MTDSLRRGGVGLVVLAATMGVGCSRDGAGIRPFGLRTYNSTVVPGPAGHPRGQMVRPQAPGIDLVRRPDAATTLDPSARVTGAAPTD